MQLYFTTIVLLFGLALTAQNPTVHTYHEGLQLDLYQPPSGPAESLVIFVHGGGFSNGNRGAGTDLCSYLASQGVACASISYTLSMKGRKQDWSCDGILHEKLKTLQLAASETWAATDYLLSTGSPLAERPKHVFIAGSSAGAEAVLAAGFYDREKLALVDHDLPADFTYSGIISGAGAMVGLHLIPENDPTPLLLFHGASDPVVPYGASSHHGCAPDDSGWLILFGSGALADHYDMKGGSYSLYQHVGAGHEIAGLYFHDHYGATLSFIDAVRGGDRFQQRFQFQPKP